MRNIYIASSWKNQHAVEMITDILEEKGFAVRSFVRNSNEEPDDAKNSVDAPPFEEWIWSDGGKFSFEYDTKWATECELLIYIAPNGQDAWAEVGACWGRGGAPILGLNAKGEGVGLMRRMMTKWYTNHYDLLDDITKLYCPLKSFK